MLNGYNKKLLLHHIPSTFSLVISFVLREVTRMIIDDICIKIKIFKILSQRSAMRERECDSLVAFIVNHNKRMRIKSFEIFTKLKFSN